MILHFSQIGFTDDLTFTVILLSIDQQSCSSIIPKIQDKCKHFLSMFFCFSRKLVHCITVPKGNPNSAFGFSKAAGLLLHCANGKPELRLWLRLGSAPKNVAYLSLQMILPLDRSYGDNSMVTLSPGRIRI